MTEPFEVTRRVIDSLDSIVQQLTAPHGDPVRVPEPDGGFHWEYAEKSPEVVQLGKLVRMVSGIRAALYLADQGMVAECACLLRVVSDFGKEILALAEGLLEGRLDKSQQKFVDQYFTSLPRSPEELAQTERERYVSREELLKAHRRMIERTAGNADELLELTRYLNKGYDSYVHGAYITTMELYHGGDKRFMLRGHKGRRVRCMYHTAVAGKLHEVLIAAELMCMTRDLPATMEMVRSYRQTLEQSREQSRDYCDQLFLAGAV